MSATTGTIQRTELQLEDNLQSAHITASFRTDARFGDGSEPVPILVPGEMEEQYTIKGNAGRVTAKATYAKFRLFGVDTQEEIR
jgi:hypothetical protein